MTSVTRSVTYWRAVAAPGGPFAAERQGNVREHPGQPKGLERGGEKLVFPPGPAARYSGGRGSTVKAAVHRRGFRWAFLKGLSDKQREEHYFCRDFVRLKKIPTWKETAKGVTAKVEEPKYKKDKHLNEKISLFRGDITKLEVDAIVNAANSSLLGGGGVDGCIHRAAGPLLTDECRTLQNCETGKAKITGGYRLPAKYVIHTVGPIAHGEPSASQAAELRSCYLSSLDLLLEHRLRSAAFPCISTGVFGYPSEAAAEVVLAALREWLEQHKDKVDRLIICVFLEKDESIYMQRLPHYFPVDSPGPTGPRSQL
ncbi:O-acetyl-ADP-ribose deacetylase MACROD1 [Puma concolor]|uniref:O-acetyl-ADP-ribose deacetylase MACROD1 n=1 Tax=Puma concolor TaxID=9696 RepID=A0A6P6H645_PUMCO|nr:O-acetyl-ADP-ribose deacetylase MACROD1 [Puma concolor]